MRHLRLAPAALLAALGALGCAGADSSQSRGARAGGEARVAPGPAAQPALCGRIRARSTGRVTTPAASELSGLVLSRSQAGVLWAHNDSGDGARLLALAPSGRLLAGVAVPGAAHLDWEDIATGPAPGPRDALYIGDIGDNAEGRPAVVVYRVAEPRLGGRAPRTTSAARPLTLRYPDRPHDAEALLVDASSGSLVIVTKDFGGRAGIYAAARPSTRSPVTTMRRSGTVSLGPGQAVTAGDVSAGGRTIVLRTYDSVFVWSRRRESLASALRRRPCRARGPSLLDEGQGETIALTRDGRAFFTVPEGRRPRLRRHAPAR